MKLDIKNMQNIHTLIMQLQDKDGDDRKDVLGLASQINDAIDVVIDVLKESGTPTKLLNLLVDVQTTVFNKYLEAGFTREEALILVTNFKLTVADIVKNNVNQKG